MNFSDIGNLICVPLSAVAPSPATTAHPYLVTATAQVTAIAQRNWLPLLVIETETDKYETIGNHFSYAVAEAAGLQRVWCIVCEDSPEMRALALVSAQDALPKTNLSTASRDEIAAALDYLLSLPDKPLKGVSGAIATNRIAKAPRQYWESFTPITKLKCGITRGKKLKALEQVFCLTPQPWPEVITDPEVLNSFSAAELKKQAKKRGLSGYSKLKKAELVELLNGD